MIDAVRSYLTWRGSPYIPTKQIDGTYGIVFILEATEANVSPRKWCAKTLNSARLFKSQHDIQALFKREMRLWLELPPHYHVLPALGLDFMRPPKELEGQFDMVPLVRMPYCEGDLSAWVADQDRVPSLDRLIALAQVCAGLQWLYKHGLQGHGDLKPNNILLRDLRNNFQLPDEGFPSKLHPWQARVTDLGWADIWSQGGGTYHAWRPYLAPERFRDTVVPEASDIYALGVIACELLTGVHPGGDRTEVLAKKWNSRKWQTWAASTNRTVEVQPPQLRDLILRCLSPDPSSRPRSSDLQATLCDLLRSTHDLEVGRQLQVEEEAAREIELVTHKPWAAEEIARASPDALDASIAQLEGALGDIGYMLSSYDIAQWLANSRSLQRLLLRRNRSVDIARTITLAKKTLDLILQLDTDKNLCVPIWGTQLMDILKPGEISFEFASEAFANLLRATGNNVQIVREYRARVEGLWRATYSGWSQVPLDELFQSATGAEWPKKEG